MKELLQLLEKIKHYCYCGNDDCDLFALALFKICEQDREILARLCENVIKAKDDIEHIKKFF